MEDLLFGGGWLDDLLRESGRKLKIREEIRDRVRALEQDGDSECEKEWRSIDELLVKDMVGEALDLAMKSLFRMLEQLDGITGGNRAVLERSLSPFLIRGREVRKVLHPPDDLEELILSRDDLDEVISLEMINEARRLLASWGAGVWGEESKKLIPRLENDMEELRECQNFFLDEEGEEYDLGFSDKEVELADKLASLATRFALDLMDLHLLNARNPEVGMRVNILWQTVRQMEKGKNVPAAAFEALQVLEEVLSLAGLGGGELLGRVDLLYERFSDAEELRQAVDHLVNASRDGEESIRIEQGRNYIQAIADALDDLGLKVE